MKTPNEKEKQVMKAARVSYKLTLIQFKRSSGPELKSPSLFCSEITAGASDARGRVMPITIYEAADTNLSDKKRTSQKPRNSLRSSTRPFFHAFSFSDMGMSV
ncbi:hypothetical protein ACLOJK_030167 [Asimina triloba]